MQQKEQRQEDNLSISYITDDGELVGENEKPPIVKKRKRKPELTFDKPRTIREALNANDEETRAIAHEIKRLALTQTSIASIDDLMKLAEVQRRFPLDQLILIAYFIEFFAGVILKAHDLTPDFLNYLTLGFGLVSLFNFGFRNDPSDFGNKRIKQLNDIKKNAEAIGLPTSNIPPLLIFGRSALQRMLKELDEIKVRETAVRNHSAKVVPSMKRPAHLGGPSDKHSKKE